MLCFADRKAVHRVAVDMCLVVDVVLFKGGYQLGSISDGYDPVIPGRGQKAGAGVGVHQLGGVRRAGVAVRQCLSVDQAVTEDRGKGLSDRL